MARAILITGGAGYIGSHMVQLMLDEGYDVVVVDDLSGGHRDAVLGGHFVHGDIGDAELIEHVVREHEVEAAIHFAGFIQVGESVANPEKYYWNNVANTLGLLRALHKTSLRRFIFSSSAAVYGEPQRSPIPEDHPKAPLNPYGRSKLMIEQMLEDYGRAYGLTSISLRYFNAAGADPNGRLGERHDPESHLIPLVLRAAAGGPPIRVFGSDYETPDGTCIRDYVHVTDLCLAHLLALAALANGRGTAAYNIGNGTGYSVREVIDTARRVTGRAIAEVQSPRRAGDPASLVADSARARQELSWQPKYENLETIIEHAWAWQRAHPLPR